MEVVIVEPALVLRHGERRDHVVGRPLPAELLLPVGVRPHLVGGRRAERQQAVRLGVHLVGDRIRELGILVRDHLVAPADQLGRVLLRHREDRAEEPDRQLAADLGHEVELAGRQRLVQDRAGDVADEVLVDGHSPAGELLRADLAEIGVARWIHLEHRLADLELFVVELLESHRARLRRVRLPVHVDGGQVVVAGDRPEPRVPARLVVPAHRPFAAQLIEPFERHALDVVVRVDQVDPIERRAHAPPTTLAPKRAGEIVCY